MAVDKNSVDREVNREDEKTAKVISNTPKAASNTVNTVTTQTPDYSKKAVVAVHPSKVCVCMACMYICASPFVCVCMCIDIYCAWNNPSGHNSEENTRKII